MKNLFQDSTPPVPGPSHLLVGVVSETSPGTLTHQTLVPPDPHHSPVPPTSTWTTGSRRWGESRRHGGRLSVRSTVGGTDQVGGCRGWTSTVGTTIRRRHG